MGRDLARSRLARCCRRRGPSLYGDGAPVGKGRTNCDGDKTDDQLLKTQVFMLGLISMGAADKAQGGHIANANRQFHGRNLTVYLARNDPAKIAITSTAAEVQQAAIDAINAAAGVAAALSAPGGTAGAAAPAAAASSTTSAQQVKRDAIIARVKKIQSEAVAEANTTEANVPVPDGEMTGRRSFLHWTTGFPVALMLGPAAPLAAGLVDIECWRLACSPNHRHIALRCDSLTLGQGYGVHRASAAAAQVVPTAVLATLPPQVASFVMGCATMCQQGGIAVALSSRFTYRDQDMLKRLQKIVSGQPEIAAADMKALVGGVCPKFNNPPSNLFPQCSRRSWHP